MKKVSLLLAFVLFLTTAFHGFAQDRKVSSSAKGAVLGGLGGAAAGAIINKKHRAVGGVVGGAAGAGLGYSIGRTADNKRRAEAARIAAANRAEANRKAAYRSGIAQGKSEAARAKAASMAAAPAAATAAPALMSSFAAPGAAPAYALSSGYLPNEAYGQREAAYPTSEVRRKSW
ncbi:glycine zipper 2TM domain-containing protein [Hymenobacter aerophilus]|uniref:glycine zipper 2TM domain-containing protein n=1 Tax=Hymenobacter aerophilus TaxID=119644 RepID=UPI00035D2A9B|nr:glycine zipper 2TM domain-containing protein [Hymenobacter aerophilus]